MSAHLSLGTSSHSCRGTSLQSSLEVGCGKMVWSPWNLPTSLSGHQAALLPLHLLTLFPETTSGQGKEKLPWNYLAGIIGHLDTLLPEKIIKDCWLISPWHIVTLLAWNCLALGDRHTGTLNDGYKLALLLLPIDTHLCRHIFAAFSCLSDTLTDLQTFDPREVKPSDLPVLPDTLLWARSCSLDHLPPVFCSQELAFHQSELVFDFFDYSLVFAGFAFLPFVSCSSEPVVAALLVVLAEQCSQHL